MRMLNPVIAICAVALVALPAFAQEGPVADMAATEACLGAAVDDAARNACIGTAADACMETDAGSSNAGMGACLSSEADWWDKRRDAAAGRLADIMRQNDKALADAGSSVPPGEPLAADAEAAWLAYRTSDCTYEAAFWGGGSGAGPASVACYMNLTAQRALWLEARVRQYGP